MSVARSADRRPAALGLALAGVTAGVALAGCATTQQQAARLQLNDARIRAAEAMTRVRAPGQAVQVAHVATVADRAGTAFVVQVRNPSRRPVSDLPISVGVRLGARRLVYLNGRSSAEDSYFDSHLPVIAAGGTLTWVYTSTRRLPRRGRPFAFVGSAPSPPAPSSAPLPVVTVRSASAAARQVAVIVRNRSDVPQYQLQVYAYAVAGGRYVAAGNLTIPQLGGNAQQTHPLTLVGDRRRGRLQVTALPTISQ